MGETDILDVLNKRECPDCRSSKMHLGLRIEIAELLTCVQCEAGFYIAPPRPHAKVFIRQRCQGPARHPVWASGL